MMNVVRVGVVGLGFMGLQHAGCVKEGAMEGALLAGLCSRGEASRSKAEALFPGVATFGSLEELIASKSCDAVILATPHYEHPVMIRAAFEAGLHVLVEKPLAVSIGAAREVAGLHGKYPQLKFGIMYNQRTDSLYRRIRELIGKGELGKITRVTWIITNWFRTDAYYRSSPWRATWKGEGGGVLINQCPHNLDLLWWMTGMLPSRITAIAHLGRTHPIEVEDEVNALFEYGGEDGQGASGHFITTTGEFPGTNRLEIAGTRAKIVAENSVLSIIRSDVDSREFRESSKEQFGTPGTTQGEERFPPPAPNPAQHRVIIQNFVEAIRNNRPNGELIAPAPEGVYALEMANGMIMSGLTRRPVALPLDGPGYDRFLAELVSAGKG